MSETTHVYDGELNRQVCDKDIESLISDYDDLDSDACFSVSDVRDVISCMESSAKHVMPTWIGDIVNGSTELVAETESVAVVSTGQYNVINAEFDAMKDNGNAHMLNSDDDERIMSGIITNIMHVIARDNSDRNWDVAYPWVIPMTDDLRSALDNKQ